jgi:CRP/FNR family transcriptional regulator, cyclic AMP receptor protein
MAGFDDMNDPDLVKNLVDELPLLSELSARERNILAAVFRLRSLKDGATLCREGDRGASFFIVAKGVIEVHKELPNEQREKLAEIGRNNLIGQVALIDGKPRSATCLAKGASLVLECARDDFDRLFQAGSPFAFKIIDQVVIDLSKRLREANLQLHELYANPKQTLLLLHEAALNIQQTITA